MRTSSSTRDGLRGAGPWLGAAGLLLSLAGCDLREIAAPNPSAIPHGPAAHAEAASVLLGTATTPIVVARSQTEVTTYQPMRPAEMPSFAPNSYVLLRLSGRVNLVTGPWWPGPPQQVATYTAVEAALSTGRAQTHVFVVGPAQGTEEPYMRAAPDGEDRIALVRINNAPAQLWLSRDLAGAIITTTKDYCVPHVWCSPNPDAGEVQLSTAVVRAD
jgi:hypothetical protein